jgi:hypothetical protein
VCVCVCVRARARVCVRACVQFDCIFRNQPTYVYKICCWAVNGDNCPADFILLHIKLQNRLVYVVTAMHLFVLLIQKSHVTVPVPLCVVYISPRPSVWAHSRLSIHHSASQRPFSLLNRRKQSTFQDLVIDLGGTVCNRGVD